MNKKNITKGVSEFFQNARQTRLANKTEKELNNLAVKEASIYGPRPLYNSDKYTEVTRRTNRIGNVMNENFVGPHMKTDIETAQTVRANYEKMGMPMPSQATGDGIGIGFKVAGMAAATAIAGYTVASTEQELETY